MADKNKKIFYKNQAESIIAKLKLRKMEGFYADERNVFTSADDSKYLEYVKGILKRNIWFLRICRLPERILRKIARVLLKKK